MGGCDSKIQKKRTFFSEMKESNENQVLESLEEREILKAKVKLEFSIEGLEIESKYQIQAQSLENVNDTFLTETVKCQRNLITFNTCYICNYFFEREQSFQISLIKNSKVEGFVQISLGQILGSRGCWFKVPITGNTNVVITAEGIINSNSYIVFSFKVINNFGVKFDKNKNRITYLITSNERKVYSSESISLYGVFQPSEIPVGLLEKGFTITFLNGNKQSLGMKNETIDNFIKQKGILYLTLNVDGKLLNIFNQSSIKKKYSFLDYIKKNVRIKLSIGIDYTSSNKTPEDPLSLHYLGTNKNDYEQAIESCGIIISYYDYNQLFPVYGFGAIPNFSNDVNFCFNVNLKNKPEIYTIDNVLKCYRNSFNYLKLASPTKFCPLIKKVIGNIKNENNPLKYHILLILTCGVIEDMQETIDALVDASLLPLSVIIIGIGNDDFSKMVDLDGDINPLVNSKGKKRERDIVQFVPFNKYKSNPTELAAQVLEEVPRQIVDYYTMKNIYPDQLESANINSKSSFYDNIKKSVKRRNTNHNLQNNQNQQIAMGDVNIYGNNSKNYNLITY